jgi:hypothetical protein
MIHYLPAKKAASGLTLCLVISIPDDRYRSGRFTEPPCQQEQHETAEMESAEFQAHFRSGTA